MAVGIIGLGRIGGNLARHALETGHEVVGFDNEKSAVKALASEGVAAASSIEDFLRRLQPPRRILIYVPHGKVTDEVIVQLCGALHAAGDATAGDVVADGGNTHWKDSIRHHQEMKSIGASFLDVGTSGGVEGARTGACFMVGGERRAFEAMQPLLRDLAAPDGVVHAGPPGAGHFVKLIHNAIGAGMVQAIAEGVDLLRRSEYSLDLPALFHNWAHGSVIRGWLVELVERGLRTHDLDSIGSEVEDTREIKWAVDFAMEKEAWIPVIAQTELSYYRYRDPESVAGKLVAILRHEFGGHPLPE